MSSLGPSNLNVVGFTTQLKRGTISAREVPRFFMGKDMGIDYTTYLGPHVRCKVTKVPSTEKHRTCSRDSCSQYEQKVYDKKTKFCVQCGSPIEDRDFPIEVDSVNAYEVRMDLLGEALYDVPGDSFHFWMKENNTHIWLANRRVPGARKFSFTPNQDGIQLVPVTPELIATEITQFSDYYEKELVILRQEYGEENVEVQWGLIHYIS